MRRCFLNAVAMGLIIAANYSTAAAGLKDGDVNIGVDLALGKLAVEFSGQTVELPELGGPLVGFGLDEPGILTIENAVAGLVPPAPGANIVLEVISFDAALKGWTPGFSTIFGNPGDLWDLGGVPAHEHPFWHIDSTEAGYVAPPGQTEWHATFRILDTGATGYLPSDPVTVTFTPEPTSLALLAFGGGLAMRSVRRHRESRSIG